MCQVQAVCVLLAICAFIQTGYAVRCWVCNSRYDVNCRDYFNTTRLNENRVHQDNFVNNYDNAQQVTIVPHLKVCEEKQMPPSDHKWMCTKTVTKDIVHYGPPIIIRACTMVLLHFKEGYCPEELNKDNVQYCEACERDGCNAGNNIRKNVILVALFPFICLLILRK